MADEAVVVLKFRPETPGNSVEENTGTTLSGGFRVTAEAQADAVSEGRK